MTNPSKPRNSNGLIFIAIFKTVKGLLLLIVSIGLLKLLHKDVADVLEHWIEATRSDPNNRFLAAILAKAGLLDDHKIKEFSALTFFYSALFLTEGTGLFMRKRWAEYLTVFATASLIPIELYETFKHATALKVAVLGINIAVVIYLAVVIRRASKEG